MQKQNDDCRQDLCRKLRLLRESHNYKQEFVADVLGIHQTGYSRIENGESDVRLSQLISLASLYHLTLVDLFGWDGTLNVKPRGIDEMRISNGAGGPVLSLDSRFRQLEDKIKLVLQVMFPKE